MAVSVGGLSEAADECIVSAVGLCGFNALDQVPTVRPPPLQPLTAWSLRCDAYHTSTVSVRSSRVEGQRDLVVPIKYFSSKNRDRPIKWIRLDKMTDRWMVR